MLLALSYPVCFVLRDLLLGGRSLGKRIFGLTILDQRTGTAPEKGTLVLRNLFLFIVHIEAIVMLITGRTLGDRAAHTVIIRKTDISSSPKMDLSEENVDSINRYTSDQKTRAKSFKKQAVMWVFIIVAAFLLFATLVVSAVKASLNLTKETEEYKLAYAYVIENLNFNELRIEEEQLEFTSYLLRTNANGIKDVEIDFKTDFFHTITVVLHDEGNGWYVCKECTEFE